MTRTLAALLFDATLTVPEVVAADAVIEAREQNFSER